MINRVYFISHLSEHSSPVITMYLHVPVAEKEKKKNKPKKPFLPLPEKF